MVFNIVWLTSVFILVSIAIADIKIALRGRIFSRFPCLFSVLRLILAIALIGIGSILAVYKIITEGESFLKNIILGLSMYVAMIHMAFGALMMEYMDRKNIRRQCPH